MPISLSAKKSLRKSVKNRRSNFEDKRSFKLLTKEYLIKPTEEGLKKIYSAIDKLAKNNIFHKNKASRLKSKYNKALTIKNVVVVVKKKTATAKKKAVKKSIAAKKGTSKKM